MRKLALILAVAGLSGTAWGQAGDFWFNFGESLMNGGLGTDLAFGGTPNDIKLTDGYRFSFRFDFNLGDHFGAEAGYAFNHTNLNFTGAAATAIGAGPGSAPIGSAGSVGSVELGMHMHQGNFNGMYYLFTPDNAKVRPFLTAGVEFDNFVPPGATLYSGSTKFGANFGGGVKFHIKGIWGARLDAREYVTPKPSFGFNLNSGALWQTELSAGVGIGF